MRTNDATLLRFGTLRDMKELLKDRKVWILEGPKRYWMLDGMGLYTADPKKAGRYDPDYPIREHMTAFVYQPIEESAFDPPKTPPETERIWLPVGQVASHVSLKSKMCRMVVGAIENAYFGMYWRDPLYTGATWKPEEAVQLRVSTVTYRWRDSDAMGELVDQDAAKEVKGLPWRKCEMYQELPRSLYQGLEKFPNNPTYRAMLMAQLNIMPPPELTTFQQIVDWVEYNFDPVHGGFPQPPATTITMHIDQGVTVDPNADTDDDYETAEDND